MSYKASQQESQQESFSDEMLRAASMLDDSMAQTLFRQEAPLSRHKEELLLRKRIENYWDHLSEMRQQGQISEKMVREQLETLDEWASKRLSGFNVLFLAMRAEREHPEWIVLMPRLLALRYEELRSARLWSALLNPMALSRLRMAIATERTFNTFEE